MKRNFRRNIYLLCVFMLLAGCSPHPGYGNGFKYINQEMQNEAVTRLEEEKVPFIVDERGFVLTRNEDKSKVDNIKKNLDEKHRFNTAFVEMMFQKEEHARKLTVLLDKYDVNYSVNTQDGDIWISWTPDKKSQVPGPDLMEKILSGENVTGLNNTEAVPSNKSLKDVDALKRAP